MAHFKIHVVDLFVDPVIVAAGIVSRFPVSESVGDLYRGRALHVVNAFVWEGGYRKMVDLLPQERG